MSSNPKTGATQSSVVFHICLVAALFAFIQAFSTLSPILLSFLLTILLSLAVNPLISRIRALTGDRKSVV